MARRTVRAAAKETAMHTKNILFVLAAAGLLGGVASAHADVHVRFKCESTVKGKCPPPPAPPAEPLPAGIGRHTSVALPGAFVASGWFLSSVQARAPPAA